MAQIGQVDIRGEHIESAVKGFANKLYKIATILMNESSDKWTETYFRESNTPLTAAGTRSVGQVARGALPPHLEPSWTEVSTTNRKFMGQSIVYYEDRLTNAINTQARTLFRVAEAIVNAKELYIYSELTGASGTSGINAASDDWDSVTIANRDVIGDILLGIAAMTENHYDVKQNGFLLLTPHDYSSLLRNDKIVNNPSFKTADVVSNGRVGQIAGLTIIESTSVDADEAMIVFGNRAATWKGVVALQSAIIDDPGVSTKVRAWEMGHIQITDPEGLYTIEGIDVRA